MNLADIVRSLESVDDSLCIVAKRPWTSESEAMLVALTEDLRIPKNILSCGYEYFLEVSIARDEVLGGPVSLSHEQLIAAAIYYAENDAYPEWLNALASKQ